MAAHAHTIEAAKIGILAGYFVAIFVLAFARHSPAFLFRDRRTFENKLTVLGHATTLPASSNKAPSRITAPHFFRIDFGVMPFTRPAVISDGVSLSDKLRGRDRSFVSEDGAFDSGLLGDCIIDIFSPNKEGVSSRCSQDDVEARADKLKSGASISVSLFSGIVSLVEG